MNVQKMLLIALLALTASATTMPTLGKVLGFGHTAAYASDPGDQGDDVDEDADPGQQ